MIKFLPFSCISREHLFLLVRKNENKELMFILLPLLVVLGVKVTRAVSCYCHAPTLAAETTIDHF